MRLHLTPMLSEPEPSSRPALVLFIALLAAASIAAGIAQLAARAGA